MRLDPDDVRFSKMVRERDDWCMRCGSMENLECSHFFARRKMSVRFDFKNADTLCHSCHAIWEFQKHEGGAYRMWKTAQLGEVGFIALEIKSQMTVKLVEAKRVFRELGLVERKAA